MTRVSLTVALRVERTVATMVSLKAVQKAVTRVSLSVALRVERTVAKRVETTVAKSVGKLVEQKVH